MDEDSIWTAVEEGYVRAADLLSGLEPELWEAQTLWDGLTVRDLAGHLTMRGLSRPRLLGLVRRHPGGTNRLIRETVIAPGRSAGPEELVRQVRSVIGVHRGSPS